MNESDERNH